jgi:protease-4
VDELGDEERARRLAAELAGLDPERCRTVTFGKAPGRLAALVPGRSLLEAIGTALRLELAWAGQPLWLFRP